METIKPILSQMSIPKPQRKFLLILFSTIMILRGRMNYRNMSRYSILHEKSFSRNFKKPFDFTELNHRLILETIPEENKKMAAIDASFVPKSGKHSYGIDYFWSGVAGKSKKGQEISSLAIVDLDYNTAYNLSVEQTPSDNKIGKKEENRIDFYLQQIQRNQNYLRAHDIIYIATDGFYSKTRFIDGLVGLGFHQVGRLRDDANLRYLYKGPHEKRKGAKKKYDGKVKYDDLSKWQFVSEIEPGVSLYTADLNSPRFKRNLRVVYLLDQRNSKKYRYALFFSTDLTLDPLDIFNMYRARFQIEFIFRDAKQFTGLTDCQARSKEALNFHFNASLTTLNLLKKQDREQAENSNSKVCSIASWKARYFNENLLDRFISHLDLDPILIKNTPQYEELINYGAISA
ncbi:transposase [Desulfobacter latus]|uniref:Transposase n=1 Tax=Desulfobacter latus TaxID=2292 RepID=A0A850T0C3_9BACT|nr:transposase [Desulfobacter latus]NWH06969.1 transposase [Desulfobacter latus]